MDDFLRDQQDFALNHKDSEKYPQEYDKKEIDRQIQADQYGAIGVTQGQKKTSEDMNKSRN